MTLPRKPKEVKQQVTLPYQQQAIPPPAILEDKIRRVAVTIKSPIPSFRQKFDIQLTLKTGAFIYGQKEMPDFRILNNAICKMNGSDVKEIAGLDPTERLTSPLPEWSDQIKFPLEFVSAKINDRAMILTDWLSRQTGRNTSVDFLICSWLDKNTKFSAHEGQKKDAEAQLIISTKEVTSNPPPKCKIAVALYAWMKKDANDISFEKDEILAFNDITDYKGWWEGTKLNGQVGLFPYNYVRELSPQEYEDLYNPNTKKSPPPVLQKPTNTGNFGKGNDGFNFANGGGNETFQNTSAAVSPSNQIHTQVNNKPRPRSRITNYKVFSPKAFDELLKNGIAMEDSGKLVTQDNLRNDVANIGDRVTIYYNAFIWDAQKQELLEYASSDKLITTGKSKQEPGPLVFVIGSKQAIDGVEEAAACMAMGQSFRVTITPEKAYQEVGYIPDIPGNAYLVFDMTMANIERNKGGFANNNAAGGAQTNNVVNRGPSSRFYGKNQQLTDIDRKPMPTMTYAQVFKCAQEKRFKELGLNPAKLEEYLTDSEFIKVFRVTRADWKLMPPYRKELLKKQHGLF